MTEFYQWAWDNFVAFIVVTGVLMMAVIWIIEAWRGEK
jgi:hypothetical protein